MDADKVLADSLNREILAARCRALDRDSRSTEWTDRDVARRMTDAGRQMAHPAVIRARKGDRTVGVAEWLTFAYALSVPPLRLLDPGEGGGLHVGGPERSGEDVRQWVHGVRPLPDLHDKGLYYAGSGRLTHPQSSHLAGVLRAVADQFDTATTDRERTELAAFVAQQAITEIQSAARLDRLPRTRKDRG